MITIRLKNKGMDVIIVTTGKTDEEARELLRILECPLENNEEVEMGG